MHPSFRSRLSRAVLLSALSATAFAMPAMADDATMSIKDFATRTLEASALGARSDGIMTALVNGSVLMERQAYMRELTWQGTPFSTLYGTDNGKGGSITIGVIPRRGELHAVSGRYELGVPEGPGTAFATYAEWIPAPPGWTGFTSFDIKEGWVDVQFSPDRTHVDMTFEFVALGDELGTRVVKSGRFSGPNYDLPPEAARTP